MLFHLRYVMALIRLTIFLSALLPDNIIALSGLGASFDTLADIYAAASDNGVDTTVDFGNGDSIRLIGVLATQLDADDFLFG